MFTKQQVNRLFADAYYSLALDSHINMRRSAEILESIRKQMDPDHPYDFWESMKLDIVECESDILIAVLNDFKKKHIQLLIDTAREEVVTTSTYNKEEAFAIWLHHYAEALVNLMSLVFTPLSLHAYELEDHHTSLIRELRSLNKWVLEGRWVDIYPLFKKVSELKELSQYHKARLLILMGQIELYYFSNPEISLRTFKEAALSDAGNFKLKAALAEYDLQFDQIDKAKNSLTTLLFTHQHEYMLHNLLGDCYRKEKNFSIAEQFYSDGIKYNILQVDSHGSLIKLYGEPELFAAKKDKILELLETIKTKELYPEHTNSYYLALRDVASCFLSNEDYIQAEHFYKQAIQAYPDLSPAYTDLAYMQIMQQQYEEAEWVLNTALANDPECYDLHWALSYLYDTWKKYEEAIKAYEYCLHLRPHWMTDHVFNYMGNIYFARTQYKLAIEYYEKALAVDPAKKIYQSNKNDALANIAAALQKNNELQEAEKVFLQIAETGEHTHLNKVGNFYFQTGRYKEAAGYYERAITSYHDEPVYHENLGLARESLALEGYDGTLPADAEAAYSTATELEKESGRSFNALGLFYYRRQNLSKAIESYTKAVDRDPANRNYLQNLIRSYGDNGQIAEAITFSYQLIKANPDDPESHAQLAFYYSLQSMWEKAIEKVEVAIKIDSDNDYVLRTAAYVYSKAGYWSEAIEKYKAILQKYEDDESSLNGMGFAYFSLGETEKAIGFYEKALSIRPMVIHYDNLGRAYERLGKMEEAEKTYRRCLEKFPGDAIIYNNLGVLQYRLGKYADAETSYKRAIELEGEVPLYLDNLATLYKDMQANVKDPGVNQAAQA